MYVIKYLDALEGPHEISTHSSISLNVQQISFFQLFIFIAHSFFPRPEFICCTSPVTHLSLNRVREMEKRLFSEFVASRRFSAEN